MNKNVTLAIDETTLNAGREYARRHNTTLNSLIRDLLHRAVQPDQSAAIEEMFAIMDRNPGQPNAWKWNREELYAERLDRWK